MLRLKKMILTSLFLLSCSSNENHQYILSKIMNHKDMIINNCEQVRLDPRLYISTIYAELFLNYDVFDEFDETRARMGYDPSIGFAQIKISTAIWIEKNYSSHYAIELSGSREQLIDKLITDELNILYSCIYLKTITEKLETQLSCNELVEISASYYGRGIDNECAEIILNTNYINSLGTLAKEFYYSQNLINEFPLKNERT